MDRIFNMMLCVALTFDGYDWSIFSEGQITSQGSVHGFCDFRIT